MGIYISQNLALIRKIGDLTQEEMAHMIKVGRASIHNYEQDATKITIKILVSICQAFGISADDILFRDLLKEKIDLDENFKVLGLDKSKVIVLPAEVNESPMGYKAEKTEILREKLEHCQKLHAEKDERIKLLQQMIELLKK